MTLTLKLKMAKIKFLNQIKNFENSDESHILAIQPLCNLPNVSNPNFYC